MISDLGSPIQFSSFSNARGLLVITSDSGEESLGTKFFHQEMTALLATTALPIISDAVSAPVASPPPVVSDDSRMICADALAIRDAATRPRAANFIL